MRKRFIVDYLTMTMDSREVCLDMLPPTEWMPSSGKFYERAYRANDAIVMLNESGSKQGSFISLGGQALADWYANREIGELIWLGQRARSITRIDLACDIQMDSEALRPRPEDFYNMFNEGQCITRVTERELTQSISLDKDGRVWDGKTCYIGARKSDRRMRIYDKAAELKVPDAFWTRFEMQHRARQAQAKFEDCLNNGVALATFNSITSFCSFGVFFEVLIEPFDAGGTGEFVSPGRKKTKLEAYLEQTKKALKARSKASPENYSKIVKWMHELFDEVIDDGK